MDMKMQNEEQNKYLCLPFLEKSFVLSSVQNICIYIIIPEIVIFLFNQLK